MLINLYIYKKLNLLTRKMLVEYNKKNNFIILLINI